MTFPGFYKSYLDTLIVSLFNIIIMYHHHNVSSLLVSPTVFSVHSKRILLALLAEKSIIYIALFEAVFLNNYHHIMLNYTYLLLHQYLQHYLLVYYLFHSYNQ